MCSRVLATIFIIYCFNSGFCEETDIVDVSCADNKDCMIFIKPNQNATCVDDMCICSNFTVEIACEPPISRTNNLVGGDCPCNIANSSCENKFCLCKTSFTPSKDKRRCIPISVPLGEHCETSSQCLANTGFSKCDKAKKICTCSEKYVRSNGHCLSAIGRQCQISSECQNSTENTICSKNECVCIHDHVASSDQEECLPNVGYNGSCIETVQCQRKLGMGSICDGGVCACDDNHYNVTAGPNNKTFCERKVAPGDYCMEHKECQQYTYHVDEQIMECYMNECVCRSGYKADGTSCVKSSGSKMELKHFLLLLPLITVSVWKLL